ncbi:MAG: glycosyltransferase family 2 protein [Candidatus Sulfotelmatobacter sp.]|jgi:glycosyltransferase involved in cell wall biosynthesis
MEDVREITKAAGEARSSTIPVSVILVARNEARNLPRCLQALRDFGEVYVVDSQSTDETVEIARSNGAKVVQFHYRGGWPKKRQWAMDTLPITHDWILLLDADEIVDAKLAEEVRSAIQNPAVNGYFIVLQTWFMGRALRHGDVGLWKLALFRRGKARFECRLKDQDTSMADMEVHEHVVSEGPTARLRNPIVHHNLESLSRYIQKHDEYSNWEAQVLLQRGGDAELPPSLWGTQAQRRRWLKRKLFAVPGSPVLLFLYRYFLRLGCLDGVPGLIYCGFQAVQMFHTKAKIYELKNKKQETRN